MKHRRDNTPRGPIVLVTYAAVDKAISFALKRIVALRSFFISPRSLFFMFSLCTNQHHVYASKVTRAMVKGLSCSRSFIGFGWF